MKNFIRAYHKYLWPVFIFLVSIGSMVARGYSFGTGDQIIQIPLYDKLLDPSLFVGDDLFPVTYSQYTALYGLILFLVRTTPLPLSMIFFGMYLIVNFLLFCGIYFFVSGITKNKIVTLFSFLMFVWHIPVAGAAITTVESALVPRFAAIPLYFFALSFLLRDQYTRLFICLSIIFLIHPPSTFLFVIVSLPFIISQKELKAISTINRGLIIFFLLTLWFMPTFIQNLPQSSFFPSGELLSVLQLRNSYAFPILWSGRVWFNLMVLLIPLEIGLTRCYMRNKFTQFDRMAFYIFITTCITLIGQLLFTSVIPLTPIITLQLGRMWWFSIAFSLLYTAFFCAYLWQQYGFSLKHLIISIIIGFLVILAVKYKSFITLPSQDWVDAQLWSRTHTNSSCTFLIDFYSQGFRVFSQRSIVGEYKDGTLSFYSPEFAYKWDRKRQYFNTKEYAGYVKDINLIRANYPFSLVVLRNGITSTLTSVYRNETYTIYLMSELEQNCLLQL